MANRNYRFLLVLVALPIAYNTFENGIDLSNYNLVNFVNDAVTKAPPATDTDTDTDTTSVTLLSSLPQSKLLSSDSNDNLISPACLPLQYNRSSRDAHANANANATANTFNYYDEFWNHKIVKRPTKIKMIHMRKAGGTTIFSYFKKVLNSNRSSFNEIDHCEGAKGCLELNDYDDGFHKYYDDEKNITVIAANSRREDKARYKEKPSRGWDDSGSTLYVTHIREPVARAISHYKYTERFECQGNFPRNDIGGQHNISVNSRSYIPPKIEDQLSTLEEFANKPQTRNDEKYGHFLPSRSKLWACSSNCYARWVTGMYNPRNASRLNKTEFNSKYPTMSEYYYNSDIGDEDSSSNSNNGSTDDSKLTEFGSVLSEEALKLLLRYDLIIVLEWLYNDPDYARNIEDMFFGGVRGITKTRTPFCSREMNYVNQLFPLEVKNTTLERLQHLNDIDTKLYRTLTSCG